MGVVYETCGWVGAAMVLGGYWLVTKRGTSTLYHALNILGAGGLVVNSIHHGALPSTSVNAVWIGIALWGMHRSSRRRPARPSGAGR